MQELVAKRVKAKRSVEFSLIWDLGVELPGRNCDRAGAKRKERLKRLDRCILHTIHVANRSLIVRDVFLPYSVVGWFLDSEVAEIHPGVEAKGMNNLLPLIRGCWANRLS